MPLIIQNACHYSLTKCMTKPILINLHPNEHSRELHYYPFAVNLVDVSEVLIHLMTCLIKHVFQIKEDLNNMFLI